MMSHRVRAMELNKTLRQSMPWTDTAGTESTGRVWHGFKCPFWDECKVYHPILCRFGYERCVIYDIKRRYRWDVA